MTKQPGRTKDRDLVEEWEEVAAGDAVEAAD